MVAVVLGACAVDAQEPDPTTTDEMPGDIATPRTNGRMDGTSSQVDVCGLAAALPEGDICRNICDPDAMAAQLAAEGAATGNCYQLYCQLNDTEHVLAGVCLAP